MNLRQKKVHIVTIDICMPLWDLKPQMTPFLDITAVWGEFFEHHSAMSFWPLTEAISELLAQFDSLSEEKRRCWKGRSRLFHEQFVHENEGGPAGPRMPLGHRAIIDGAKSQRAHWLAFDVD